MILHVRVLGHAFNRVDDGFVYSSCDREGRIAKRSHLALILHQVRPVLHIMTRPKYVLMEAQKVPGFLGHSSYR